MSESAQGAIGQALRTAREAQGLTVEEAANRLRLMHRQIDAMETEDFESLGQPVFARGFVRNYARLLGIEPESLLVHMAGAPTDAAPVSHAVPPPPGHWLTSPWLLLLLLGVLFVAAVPVALYWWLNSDAEEDMQLLETKRQVVLQAATPVAVPGVSASLVPVAPPTDTAQRAPESQAEAAMQAADAPAAPPLARSTLHLDFGGESWVEIKDASGRMLMRQLNLPDTRVDVHGQPPFDVVVGNATQVRLSYNGRPIDLAPFIDVTVARFTLEE